jgi:hypothetical protein
VVNQVPQLPPKNMGIPVSCRPASSRPSIRRQDVRGIHAHALALTEEIFLEFPFESRVLFGGDNGQHRECKSFVGLLGKFLLIEPHR